MKSDMFDECDEELLKNGFKVNDNYEHNIEVGSLIIKSKKEAEMYQKEMGEYYIINSPYVHLIDENCCNYTENVISKCFKRLINKKDSVFIVGLGNPSLISDSLGDKVIKKIIVDVYNSNSKVFAMIPDVYIKTGIKTSDIIEAVTNKLKPDLVVIIDSLGTLNEKRIATSFQITTSGIVPGGALNNENKIISKDTLKTDCIAIGVPLMLINKEPKTLLTDVLCPKNIDEYVERCSQIIANVLNKNFHRKTK